MSIRRRQLLINKSKKNLLPVGYTRLQWLTTAKSGLNYIKLNYTPNQDTRVLTEFRLEKANTYSALFGTEKPRFSFITNRFDYNTTMFTLPTENQPVLNKWHSIDFNKNTAVFDGVVYEFAEYATFKCTNPLCIFQLGGYYQTKASFWGSMKYFKIYENDVLLHSYVPVSYNEQIGLYDVIDKVFLTPTTGTFTAGPVL